MTDNQPPGRGRGFEKRLPAAKSARKNLFGRDQDIEESLAREIADAQRRDNERWEKRWNFDPRSGPQSGSYEWDSGTPLDQRLPLLSVPQEEKTSVPATTAAAGDVGNPVLSSSENSPGENIPASSSVSGTSQAQRPCASTTKRPRSPSLDDEYRPPPKSPKR